MPIKKTKKSELKTKANNEKMKVKKEKAGVVSGKNNKIESKSDVKKDTTKKGVIKRRKADLKPSRASAVAIVSQANRAKKQALIEKLSRSDISQNKKSETGDTRIPLWVWIFFGCSLMLFCISFYQAVILRPQVETKMADNTVEDTIHLEDGSKIEEEEGNVNFLINDNGVSIAQEEQVDREEIISNPQNPEELIQSYFAYMSAGNFDESFNLFDSRTQNDKNIREHFTAFRMAPFFEGIEGKSITPQNIHKISETYRGNEVYVFDISYVLDTTHEKYDETWKFSTSDRDGVLKILMLYCISSKCSRHPIFGPEEFGLMR